MSKNGKLWRCGAILLACALGALLATTPATAAVPDDAVVVYPTGDPTLVDVGWTWMTEDNRRLIDGWNAVNGDPAKTTLFLKATNEAGDPTPFVLNEEDPAAYAVLFLRVGAFGTDLVGKAIVGETVGGFMATIHGARVIQPIGAEIHPGRATLRIENVRFQDIGVYRPNNRGGIHSLVYVAPFNRAITFPFELEMKGCHFEGTNAPGWMYLFHHGRTQIEDCTISGTPSLAAVIDVPSYVTADRPDPVPGDSHVLTITGTEVDAGGAAYGILAFRNALGWNYSRTSSLTAHDVTLVNNRVQGAGVGIAVQNLVLSPSFRAAFTGDMVIDHNDISATEVGIYASHDPDWTDAEVFVKSNTITMADGSYAAIRFGDASPFIWPEKEKVRLAGVRNNLFRGGALTGVSMENGSFRNTFTGNNIATFTADASYRCDAATYENVVVGFTGGITWVDDQGTDNVFTGAGFRGLSPAAAQQLAEAMSAYPPMPRDLFDPADDSSLEAPLD